MIAWLVAQPWALRTLKWLAIAAAVLAVLLGVRNSGRQAERVANLQRALDAAQRRKHVDAAVARRPAGDVRDELLDEWSRD
jgi:cobalamin biosynthesis protein CobD/CbiB